jgi:predicted phosphodiesterase
VLTLLATAAPRLLTARGRDVAAARLATWQDELDFWLASRGWLAAGATDHCAPTCSLLAGPIVLLRGATGPSVEPTSHEVDSGDVGISSSATLVVELTPGCAPHAREAPTEDVTMQPAVSVSFSVIPHPRLNATAADGIASDQLAWAGARVVLAMPVPGRPTAVFAVLTGLVPGATYAVVASLEGTIAIAPRQHEDTSPCTGGFGWSTPAKWLAFVRSLMGVTLHRGLLSAGSPAAASWLDSSGVVVWRQPGPLPLVRPHKRPVSGAEARGPRVDAAAPNKPLPDIVRLAFVSDSQAGAPTLRRLLTRVRTHSPDVVIHGGDAVQAALSHHDQSALQRGDTAVAEQRAAEVLAAQREAFMYFLSPFSTLQGPQAGGPQGAALLYRPAPPLLLVRGNHDDDTRLASYMGALSLSASAEAPTRRHKFYYATTVGDVRVIVLDSADESAEQVSWLSTQLAMASRVSQPARRVNFIVAVVHVPPFIEYWDPVAWSKAGESHWPDHVRTAFVPLFAAGGVDVVLSGHSHLYQRGAAGNVTYVISGGGGGSLEVAGEAGQVQSLGMYAVTRLAHHWGMLTSQPIAPASDMDRVSHAWRTRCNGAGEGEAERSENAEAVALELGPAASESRASRLRGAESGADRLPWEQQLSGRALPGAGGGARVSSSPHRACARRQLVWHAYDEDGRSMDSVVVAFK